MDVSEGAARLLEVLLVGFLFLSVECDFSASSLLTAGLELSAGELLFAPGTVAEGVPGDAGGRTWAAPVTESNMASGNAAMDMRRLSIPLSESPSRHPDCTG